MIFLGRKSDSNMEASIFDRIYFTSMLTGNNSKRAEMARGNDPVQNRPLMKKV